ncbi:type III pantothenate kinase [bacterium]|nr:type III pantothenate kinase [bacterium]
MDPDLHLLTVDIGNTQTGGAVFAGERIERYFTLSSSRERTADEWEVLFAYFLNSARIQAAVFISVVPPIGVNVHRALTNLGMAPQMLSPRHLNLMEIRLDRPFEVGADRIVNAFAARELYGAPVVVVDLGTATTWDVVDRKGDFLGGAIAPGIEPATRVLAESTAKLPKVRIERPHVAIGRNTINAMESGIYYGTVGAIEGLSRRIARELGDAPKVIATGGWAELIAQDCEGIDVVDPHLVHKGLRLIYQRLHARQP